MIRVAILVVLILASCGGSGASNECEALDRLSAVETKIDKEMMAALEDYDLGAMSGVLDEVASEATEVRDSFPEADLAPRSPPSLLRNSASNFVGGANLLNLAMNSAVIRGDDVDSAMEKLMDGRLMLSNARRDLAEECGA